MSATPPASSEGRVRAVVAGHGDFAVGLVSAVHQITGRGDAFATMSNRDMSPAAIAETLQSFVAAGVRVVFTDLPAGSVALAARRLQRAEPALLVVVGTNLPVLLDFVFSDSAAAPEAARAAVEKGRLALQAVQSTPPAPAAPSAPAQPTGGSGAD